MTFHDQGLAMIAARRYWISGYDLDDLYQEACLAIYRADPQHDPRLGSRSGYLVRAACFALSNLCARSLNHKRCIHLDTLSLNAIRDAHSYWQHPATLRRSCVLCDQTWPCLTNSDAVAAITILDEAHESVWLPEWLDLGHTTSFTGFGIDPAPYGHRGYVKYRLVPDSGVTQPNHDTGTA